MNDYLKGQLDSYCYMVKRGKPAANIPVQKRYVEDIQTYVNEHKLNLYAAKMDEEWASIWIYKYAHILDVIKALQQATNKMFYHWALGKLFGYEESEIQHFINRF